MAILKNAFNERQVFPENMLGYNLTYSGTSNSKGKVSMSILIASEGVIVFPINNRNQEWEYWLYRK